MHIGRNIRELRLKNGLTQENLAERLGVSYQAVSKWETNANTPDIALLPEIAKVFGISIDELFSDSTPVFTANPELIKDDDVIRIVQMKGRQIQNVTPMTADNPPLQIIFPRDFNENTQYFKVEIFGHVIADASINGDVVCHGSIQCSEINSSGGIHSDGDIRVHEINSSGDISCGRIEGCYNLQCRSIDCSGSVDAVNLTCDRICNKDEN